MNLHFTIGQISTTFSKRPPISSKVREYFEVFMHTNLLEKKNIIIQSKWQVRLLMSFIEEGPRYKSDYLFMAKTTTTITSEKIKIYEILIPLKLLNGASDPYLKTIELMFDALTIFFTSTYKSITISDMQKLWEIVDVEYLRSLPYPAVLSEQKYASDIIDNDGGVTHLQHKFG